MAPDSGAEHVSHVQEIFDGWARAGKANRMADSHALSARTAFEKLELQEGSSYLDIGCGNGYTVRWAAETSLHGRCVGVDIAGEMIALARNSSLSHSNTTFCSGVFPGCQFEDESFDAVFSMEVFYYLSDVSAGVREVKRLLKPGGRFACVVDYYGENTASHSWPQEVGVDMTLLNSSEWRSMMIEAGLVVLEQERIKGDSESDVASEPGHHNDSWKFTEGSLFTLAQKPIGPHDAA